MAVIDEIAPDIFRISTFVAEWNLQFNQFLIRDEEPLLFHTGMRAMFPDIHKAVSKVIKPSDLRWISFSHFEVDECGALNDWLEVAPNAQPACSIVAARVNLADFSIRPARELSDREVFETGKLRIRFLATPHFPHGWDAGMLFEETTRTLFCSDILHQFGNGRPVVESDLTENFRSALTQMEAGPLAHYMPYYKNTGRYIRMLADLRSVLLATMHGSAFAGDGAGALRRVGEILRETLGSTAEFGGHAI